MYICGFKFNKILFLPIQKKKLDSNYLYSFNSHLKPRGEEGQKGRTSGRGWQLSFKKSLQQKTPSVFWLKLVPYRTGDRISALMYFALSSNGSSKNFLLALIMLSMASLSIPWFTNCTQPKTTNESCK